MATVLETMYWERVSLVLLAWMFSAAVSLGDLHRRCNDGEFGYKCKFRCHCKNDEACNKVTGDCYSGCADDYWGPGCQLSNSCFYNTKPKSYMGTKSVTRNLYICQRWDSQQPHKHNYKSVNFADRAIPENYCRTTPDANRPWCYTSDRRMRWDYCNVDNCDCPHGRFGNNCAKECHCFNDAKCDSILGTCPRKCETGWTQYDCQKVDSCPANMYGWDCSERCHCKNPSDCHRFNGPLPTCQCRSGYFNSPRCEPVTPPLILGFSNTRVNPGQMTVFNCTVSSYPPPAKGDIRLVGSQNKRIHLWKSNLLQSYMYTRINLFQVENVAKEEQYTCHVEGIAGQTSRAIQVDLFELPRLNSKPVVPPDGISPTNLTIQWPPWNPSNGDTGDPPIRWYSIWVRSNKEESYRMMGYVYHTFCRELRVCAFTIPELLPSTRYAIYIVTKRDGNGGKGKPGPVLHVKTLCSPPEHEPHIETFTAMPQYNTSVPKIKITVTWTDPDIESWNCEQIVGYFIRFTTRKYGIPPRLIELAGSSEKSLSISDLEPATWYCVKIWFQTNEGSASPETKSRCVLSPETLPPAPRNLYLKKRFSTSVVVGWDQPEPPRGNITSYRVAYWDTRPAKGQDVKATEYHSELALNNLQPFTHYKLTVRAKNSAGVGDSSEVLSFTTDESLPGFVRSFRNTSRSSHSVEFRWMTPANPNGQILFYTLSCCASEDRDIKVLLRNEHKLPSNKFREEVVGLSPATEYVCTINASTSKGTGPMSRIRVWTKGKVPKAPLIPQIMEKSENTVTVHLAVSYDEDAVSFYRLILEKVSDGYKSKRSADIPATDASSDYYTAQISGSSSYVTAELVPGMLKEPFLVGDNKTYGGYYNGPLQKNQAYNIWFGAYSTVDGSIEKSFSRTTEPFVVQSVAAAPETNHIPVIIGVLLVFVFLIITFAILLLIWRKKHVTAEREKADIPSFGPTILPEPDTSPPPTPIDDSFISFLPNVSQKNIEIEPLIESTSNNDDSEPLYGNLGVTIPPVKVEDLWDYIKRSKENDMEGLKKEYKLIPAGLTAKCDVAKRPENKIKNRYGNIVAYDHSRVKLRAFGEEITDDYINANYIDGYEKTKAYIAAQGPNRATLGDIWRMAWQENSKTVIMLTNPTETGKRKCDQYWPDSGTQLYAEISVQILDANTLPDFTIRTFLLTKDGMSKVVKQFHYTTWPDHGVPKFANSLILFRQKIRAYDFLDNGPVIVHCSAGVGRTGTYVAVDAQLEMARDEGIVDVHNFVQLMRTQRVNMVQTLEQYVFVYDVLLEALLCGDTTIPCSNFRAFYGGLCQYDHSIGKTKLEEQFEILRLISATMDRDETTMALRPENIFKNRCKNITPANRCRPYLTTPAEGCNDYINGVFVNSYKRRDAFIVSQMPLPNTVVDFWRLIYDHNCYCIVMLNEVDPADESCEMYWTLDTCGENYGPFIVETTAEIKSEPSITVRDFTITNTRNPQDAPRVVRQYHFHRWADGSNTPNSKLALLELLDMVEKWQQQTDNRPVVVHCMNGASQSGLFCAVSAVLERIRADKEVDVFQAVKQLRLNRSQLVDNFEQFRFCHDIVLDYINADHYSKST